jgi:hypothetical protein
MPASIIAIADAVSAELNATSFSQAFTAARHYEPTFELSTMSTLRVSVVPRAMTSKTLDRSRDSFDFEIDVAVQKKTDPTLANLDELMALAEEIADHLRLNPLSTLPDVRCMEVVNAPIYASEHLQEFRQFTSVLTLTYRKYR